MSGSARDSSAAVQQAVNLVVASLNTAPADTLGANLLNDYDSTINQLATLVSQTTQQLNRHLSSKRQERNALLPIYRLPHELLLHISSFVLLSARTSTERYAGARIHPYYRQLYTLLRVSHRWNSVLKTSPTVWSFIPAYADRRLIEQALQSSAVHGIDLETRLPSKAGHIHRSGKLLDGLLTDQIHRWRAIDFELADLSDDPELKAVLAYPIPSIESIRLEIERGRSPSYYQGSVIDLFQGSAPKLKHVELSGVQLKWTSPVLAGLLTLHLGYIPHTRISLCDLCQVLQACPDLRDLQLMHIATPGMDTTLPFDPVVSLPKLQNLALTSVPLALCRYVIKNVCDVPSMASIAVEPNHNDMSTITREHFIDTLTSMRPWFSVPTRLVADQPELQLTCGHNIRCEAYPTGPQKVRRYINFDFVRSTHAALIWCLEALRTTGRPIPIALVVGGPITWTALCQTGRTYGLPIVDITLREAPGTQYWGHEPRHDHCSHLLDHLGLPFVENGAVRWPYEDLGILRLDVKGVATLQVLSMVTKRYNADETLVSRWTADGQHIQSPKVFKLFLRSIARDSDESVKKIRSIIGQDKLELTAYDPIRHLDRSRSPLRMATLAGFAPPTANEPDTPYFSHFGSWAQPPPMLPPAPVNLTPWPTDHGIPYPPDFSPDVWNAITPAEFAWGNPDFHFG